MLSIPNGFATDDNIDLFNIDEPLVNIRNERRIGVIVMANQLDGTSEQTAAGINILLTDVMSEFCRPAIASERTS